MNPTKEEWDLIKRGCLYGWANPVELLIDGYSIRIAIYRVTDLKFRIIINVNGERKTEWLNPENVEYKEIQNRFLRLRKKCCCPTTYKNVKKFGVRGLRDLQKRCTIVFYDITWNSFAQLIKHLQTHNKSIEVKGPEYLVEQLEKMKAKPVLAGSTGEKQNDTN